MKNKVYVLLYQGYNEGDELLGIYYTEDSAKEAMVADIISNNHDRSKYIYSLDGRMARYCGLSYRISEEDVL